MKVCEMANDIKVFVNSKYEPEIFAQIEEGKDIEVVQDGKFWRVMPESLGIIPKPKTSSGGYKTSQIKEAQARKEASIAAAQDRTQTMWAKNNACTLIAHHPAFKELTEEQVKSKIADLTNAILNMELLPF